ncbi:hypothetical protein ACFX2I_045837 [Malus domestica]
MQPPFLESMLDAELIVTVSFLFSVRFEFLCRVTAYLCAVKLCIFSSVFFPLEISLWEVPSFYDSIHLQFCTKIASLSNSVIDLVVDEIQNLQYFQWMHHKAIEEASTD